MGCHPQRESEGDAWTWEARYLDGTLPVEGVAEVWSVGAVGEGGWAIASGKLLGSMALFEGRGEWPASDAPLVVNVRATHPNGSTQNRQGVRVQGQATRIIELPTPTRIDLHIARPRLTSGRLHARLAADAGEPNLSTWLGGAPSSATAVMAPHAVPLPLRLEFEFPVGMETWPLHVQWYWQPDGGGLEPLRTEVFEISREHAGSVASVQSSI
jgi:hypothetical protein